MLNSIDDMIAMHTREGKIEDAYQRINFDNKVLTFNTYTLRVRKGNTTREETKKWNATITNELKKDRNLYKEAREFISLFELFHKLRIKTGYIEKSESPDFVLSQNGIKTGIEITKIYVGNDWIAERVAEEVKAFKARKRDVQVYDEYRKFQSRIVTFQIRGGIVIMPTKETPITLQEYIIEIKNKIFEKIRKLIDDYQRYERNMIFVEVVSPRYFNTEEEIQKLNEELKYYISHLDGFDDEREYNLILKTATSWTCFHLKDGSYESL